MSCAKSWHSSAEDFRIDEIARGALAVAMVEVHDDHPHRLADLDGGQADARAGRQPTLGVKLVPMTLALLMTTLFVVLSTT